MSTEDPTGALPADLAPGSVDEAGQLVPRYRADQIERAMFEIRSEQNLLFGAIAGAVAGAIGAIIWAAVTVVATFQIGWMAIGIGFLVGAAVRWAGRGTTTVFGVIGAALALCSVLIGNVLSVLGLIADAEGISYSEMILSFDYSQTFDLLAATFSPIDLLFYGIAIWEGYRFSIREVEMQEIHEHLASQGITPSVQR